MAERTTSKKPAGSGRKKAPARSAPKRQGAATPKRGAGQRRPEPRRGSAAATASIPPDLVEHFGQEHLDLVRAECVPHDASAGDVLRLLLEARRLGADPLRGDVYLARGVARDGAEYEYAVAAKRDALLRFAERHADFLGHDESAIYAEDDFTHGDPQADGRTLRERAGVVHRTGNPAGRGALAGAWCAVERAGRPPLVFVATAAEYLRPEDVEAMELDDPRRRYPDRYLVKVAMCWPLRMAYGLNDVVGAEEIAPRPAPLPAGPGPAAPLIEQPLDELGARISALYHEAGRNDPRAWPLAKVRARLLDADDAAREQLADEMEASLRAVRGERQPTPTTEAPVAERANVLRRRLAELDDFDPGDLDEEDLQEYRREREAVEAAITELGFDPRDPDAEQDVGALRERARVLHDRYDELRALERAEEDPDRLADLAEQRGRAAVDCARAERLVAEADAR